MNFAGQAQALAEEAVERSLRNRTRLTMPFSGACHSCKEPVSGKRQFCDSERHTDWENKRRRKSGAIR